MNDRRPPGATEAATELGLSPTPTGNLLGAARAAPFFFERLAGKLPVVAKGESRRSFLKKGLIGGVLLAGAALGLAKFPGRLSHKPRRALRVFDEREFAVVAAVAARIVP